MGVLEQAKAVNPKADLKAQIPVKSQVRAKGITERTQETLHAEINKDVAAFSELYTDAWRRYSG